MTYRSPLQNVAPRIHSSHCKCKRCTPIKLAGDSSWLPDPPASIAMIIIGTIGLITHLIMFT